MTSLLTFGETSLRLSPPGRERLETADELSVWASGAASNVAVAAGRLGTEATWTTRLADTPLGRRVVSELRGHGIAADVAWADADAGRQGLTFHEGGPRPRQDVVIDDRRGTAVESATPGDLPMDAVQSAGAVFASGETVALGETAADTVEAVLRAAGGDAVLGLDYRPDLWSPAAAREAMAALFPAADAVVTDVEDARTVLNLTGEAAEVAHRLGAEYDLETVVVTRGDRGALVYHDATVHERDAVAAETVDASGQQAAFTGAFFGRWLAGDAIGTALTHGVAAAALARTVPGPVPTVDPGEVERLAAAVGGTGGETGGTFR